MAAKNSSIFCEKPLTNESDGQKAVSATFFCNWLRRSVDLCYTSIVYLSVWTKHCRAAGDDWKYFASGQWTGARCLNLSFYFPLSRRMLDPFSSPSILTMMWATRSPSTPPGTRPGRRRTSTAWPRRQSECRERPDTPRPSSSLEAAAQARRTPPWCCSGSSLISLEEARRLTPSSTWRPPSPC